MPRRQAILGALFVSVTAVPTADELGYGVAF
jgi:hypothetical protein